MNDGEDRLKPRWGIFYGDTFTQICRVARLPNTSLIADHVASGATLSKLRKRFKGVPIERATADRIIDYLNEKILDDAKSRLAEKGLDIKECILPATYRLTDDARVALGTILPFRVTSQSLRTDHFYEHSVRQLRDGHFGIRRHVVAVARMILERAGSIRGVTTVDDMVHHELIDEACYPACYRVQLQRYQKEFSLVRGGRA